MEYLFRLTLVNLALLGSLSLSSATVYAKETAEDKLATKNVPKNKAENVKQKSAVHSKESVNAKKQDTKTALKTSKEVKTTQKNSKANQKGASVHKEKPKTENSRTDNPKTENSKAKVEQSKNELSNIHQRIESLQKDLAYKQGAQADVTDALKQSEKSISDTNRKLFELNQQHKENRNTLSALQFKKANLEATIAQQKQLIAAQYYQQYIHGKPNYIQIVLQEQQPGAMARQLQYLSYVSRARSELIESMNANLGAVIKLNEQSTETLIQITSLKTEQEKQRLALVAEKNEHNQVLAKLSTQISAQRNEIEKLKRDEANLSQLVENLNRKLVEQAARQKLARSQPKPSKPQPNQAGRNQAKEQVTPDNYNTEPSTPQRSTTIARNDTLPSEAFEGGNFGALRGKLNLPVRGELTNHFGDTRADTGVSWKGLFIRANEGSEVKSIASGRVVFADWMRGFGNLLIIDHGDGYMSLYGNNQALLRKVGDTVKGGDTVASVGNSGGNESNGLYYELRKQSKPFDPLSWSVVR